jgi:hypothetical protein
MRRGIPRSLRTKILLANRHACCVCERGDVQIHHIDSNHSNNREENLAVLCQPHHDKATAPPSLTAQLEPAQVRKYKHSWEAECTNRSVRMARSRTAFFMVDYKNPERIRQLFTQLSRDELLRSYGILRSQFREEDVLRKQQGFDVSLEPTTALDPMVEQLLDAIPKGDPHPDPFKRCTGHSLDPLYPVGFVGGFPAFAYYDAWCQIMVRAIIAVRGTYDLEDLTRLREPMEAVLRGKLISFKGSVRGRVALPSQYQAEPISKTKLHVRTRTGVWRTVLNLKTHYVYSTTATMPLSRGTENGLLVMRSVDAVRKTGPRREVEFSCTPLIIGNGALEIPDSTISG